MGRMPATPARRLAPLALAAAAIIALVGCTPAGVGTTWETDVYYGHLAAGSCLENSYDGIVPHDEGEFSPNAGSFHVVDCSQPHRAQVIGEVGIPAALEWDDYGSGTGPSADEASDLLEETCLAYAGLVADWQAAHGGVALTVSPNFAALGDDRVGTCIAHLDDLSLYDDAIDVERMIEQARAAGFGAQLGGTGSDWFADPLEVPVATYWSSLDPYSCVATFPSPDEEYYDIVACTIPHEAQLLGWARMPGDWTGYRGDAEAQAVVDAVCAAAHGRIAGASGSPVPDLVAVTSTVGSDLVIDNVLLGQCWVHLPGLAPLDLDLRGVGAAAEPAESDEE